MVISKWRRASGPRTPACAWSVTRTGSEISSCAWYYARVWEDTCGTQRLIEDIQSTFHMERFQFHTFSEGALSKHFRTKIAFGTLICRRVPLPSFLSRSYASDLRAWICQLHFKSVDSIVKYQLKKSIERSTERIPFHFIYFTSTQITFPIQIVVMIFIDSRDTKETGLWNSNQKLHDQICHGNKIKWLWEREREKRKP